MNKKSDVDILIEQCIQDTNGEYLEEGFVDNVKAGLNGAKEWLKADARNSFKLRKKSDMKNDRRWSQRKGKVSSYAKSIANTLQDYKKSGGTLGRGMKVDDVISRLNQVAQGKYPRGNAQTSAQNQQNAASQSQPKQSNNQQQTQSGQKTQQAPKEKANRPSNNTPNNVTANNTDAQNRMLDSIGGNDPQENTSSGIDKTSNNGFSAEANELLQTFGSFKSKDTDVVDKLQEIYNNLSDDEKEKIKQQINPDIINLINLQQSKAPYEQLNQTYGSLSPQDRGIFRVISGMKHPSQVNTAANRPSQSPTNTGTPVANNQNQDTSDSNVKSKDNAKPSAAKKETPAAKRAAVPKPVGVKPTNNAQPQKKSSGNKQTSKKKLSPVENAREAIARAQVATQEAKSKAPKLNLPNGGKPVKRKTIVTAKQRKDIDAASKEMEDFHRSLGDTGAEWEERIHESYYGSNTQGQLSMLNSIR